MKLPVYPAFVNNAADNKSVTLMFFYSSLPLCQMNAVFFSFDILKHKKLS